MNKHVLSALAAVVLLAGCNGPAGPATTTAGDTPAASAPAEASTAPAQENTTATTDLPGTNAGESVDTTAFMEALSAGQASVKTYKEVSTATTKLGNETSTSVTTGVVDQSDPNHVKSQSSMDDPAFETVLDGPKMYTREGSGAWKSTDISGAVEQMQAGAGQFTDAMKEAMKVTYAGEEAVEGVQTRRYDVQIEMAGLPGLTNSYWLNEAGFPIKQVSTTPQSTTEMVRSNFNEPVTIEVPQV